MNKLLIVLLMPWCLLVNCSEPENGGNVRVTLGEVSGEGSNFPAGSTSSHQIQQVVPAIAPTKINEGRLMLIGKPEAKQKAIACRPSPKLYGGYTFDQIVNAIISHESEWDRKARGRDTERGLMQVKYKTWRWTCKYLLKKDVPWKWAFHPYWNKLVGKRYLQHCFDSFEGSPTQRQDAIRAYNKGVRGARLGRGWDYLRKVQRKLR